MNEEKVKVSELPPAARMLLIPLAYRAQENRRGDSLLYDEEELGIVLDSVTL